MSGDRPSLPSAGTVVDEHRQPVAASTRKVGMTSMTVRVSVTWGGSRQGTVLESRGSARTDSSVTESSEVFSSPSGDVERGT